MTSPCNLHVWFIGHLVTFCRHRTCFGCRLAVDQVQGQNLKFHIRMAIWCQFRNSVTQALQDNTEVYGLLPKERVNLTKIWNNCLLVHFLISCHFLVIRYGYTSLCSYIKNCRNKIEWYFLIPLSKFNVITLSPYSAIFL